MEKISIIIPIYNSEKYLRECLESVRNQDHDNFEVILVNDGSTDNSIEICEEYLRKDKRFIVINQENKGSSEARNAGMKIFTGEYLAFVDSDDTISPCFLSNMYKCLKEHNADIVMCDFQTAGMKEHSEWDDRIFIDKEIFSGFLKGEFCNRILNKLYSRKVVEGVMFPQKRNVMEDANWTALIFERCECIVRISNADYLYRYVENSLSRKKLSEEEECGSYRNMIEKLMIVNEHLTNEQDFRTILNQTRTVAHRALVSFDNLKCFEVYEKLRMLIQKVLENETDKNILFNIILSIEDYRTAQKRYFVEVLKSREISLKDKLKMVYRRFKRNYAK